MTRTWTLLLMAVCSLPATTWAQTEAAPPVKDRKAVTFNEIERGFHFGLAAGAWFTFNPPTVDPRPRPFSAGQELRLEMGVDIGSHVSVALFGMLTSNRMPAEYIGFSNGAASGDFTTLTPGALVKLSLLGIKDGQDVKRVWLYLRAGAGYSFFYPRALLPENDVLVFAGPGVEYFTRLRHFSIGLEAVFNMMVIQKTIGFAVTPTVRYAF